MSYLLLDDEFAENKKVEKLHDKAFRFHVASLCYCARNLTDGHVDAKAVKIVGVILETAPKRWTTELVGVKLWTHDAAGDGFWINDYLDYNPSAVDVKAKRDQKREAGRRGADARWHSGRDSSRHSVRDGEPQMPTPLPSPPLTTVKPPRVSSYEGDDAHASKGDTLGRLVALASSDGDRAKVLRAAAGLSEAELVNALEAARGPAVRDRLGAGLARMKRHREGRAA